MWFLRGLRGEGQFHLLKRKGDLWLRGGVEEKIRGISPFEAVASTRAHLFFGLGGALEGCWRLFFF